MDIIFLECLAAISVDDLKTGGPTAPKSLRPAAADAYLMFQVCIMHLIKTIRVIICVEPRIIGSFKIVNLFIDVELFLTNMHGHPNIEDLFKI